MALSNIFREPARELTEQAIGMAAMAGILAAIVGDYALVYWALAAADAEDRAFATFMIGTFSPIGIILLLLAAHGLGEAICGALARRGLDPRPMRRR